MGTFLASAARQTSGTFSFPTALSKLQTAVFILNVSAAAAAAGDTLDVYIQSTMDGGTTWNDFVHFTQVLGNGGTKKFQAGWSSMVTPEVEQGAAQDAAMSAGVNQGPVGPTWRAKWVIAGSTPNFTFGINMEATRRPR